MALSPLCALYSRHRDWVSSAWATRRGYALVRRYLRARKDFEANQRARATAASAITQPAPELRAPYAAANAMPAKPIARSPKSAPNARLCFKEPRTSRLQSFHPRGVAQLVERRCPKPYAGGSSPYAPARRAESDQVLGVSGWIAMSAAAPSFSTTT